MMVIAGRTDLLSHENTIRIEPISGPTSGRIPVVWLHDWNADGNWSVVVDTEGVEPGVYTQAVEAGDATEDRVQVRIRPAHGNETTA